jgi:hypothetical protein
MPKRPLYARSIPIVRLAAAAAVFAGTSGAARAQPAAGPAPCAACITLVAAPGQALPGSDALNGLEVIVSAAGQSSRSTGNDTAAPVAVMEQVRSRGGRPGLLLPAVSELPATEAVAMAHRIVLDLDPALQITADLVFRLKTRLTELRAARAGLLLGLSGRREAIGALLGQELGPYVDFVAVPTDRAPYPAHGHATGVTAIVAATEEALRLLSPERWLVPLPADAADASRLLHDVARAAPLLGSGLIEGGSALVSCGSTTAATYLDPGTLDTLAVARGCAGGTLAISPDAAGVERVTLSGGDVIVRVPAAEGRFAEGVQVVGARQLGVREIVARHQVAAARQRRAVRQLISSGSMTLTFEAPGFPAPIAITSRAIIYTAPDRTEIEQQDVRVNGIVFRSDGIPRLPLLEPERVASPPLAIALGEVYRYSLDGEATIAGRRCYVVSFEPHDRSRPLFAGRAWIAADTFAMVRVSAVQTGLRGAIVASQQTDEFRAEGDAWLLARSEVRQIYEGPGHRTPIHRVLAIDRHEVNPSDFDSRRAAAYASASIMLRDTPQGFRYLRRDAPGKADALVEPVVTGPANRVRTLALGVIIDPNISTPLPFAGLSYVDFDLFGTGTQMNGFFGGTYGQLAVSVPSIGGSRWQLAGRAFGIASAYNDRAFVEGREIYRANIAQRPAHASVWLLRPLTATFTARAGYDFDYTHYDESDSTSPTFRVPASQSAHALRLALEGQAAGWTASLWWAGARRAGWRAWGEQAVQADGIAVEGFEPGQADYQRVGATLGRSVVVSPRLVGKVEAAWMSGRDLDRFSRYTFGSFDNRLHGYPSALIRYDRGAVVRASAAWAAGAFLRIDGFLDTAYVHDPGFGSRSRSYTGIGAAAEVPAPFGTLLAVEWGYGFQGINADGRRGTHVVRISGYKMF